jgi:hypothetical protein
MLYGFAMCNGLGVETARKDVIKVGVIVFQVLLFSIPIFWFAFRLLEREESFEQVAAVPLTLVSSVSIILAMIALIVKDQTQITLSLLRPAGRSIRAFI